MITNETIIVGITPLGNFWFIRSKLVYVESMGGLHVTHCENALLIKLKIITVAMDKNPTAPGDLKSEL